MKQLSGYMVLKVNGGRRISYTYDEIDDETGELLSANNKKSFFALDETLNSDLEKVEKFIIEEKLQ